MELKYIKLAVIGVVIIIVGIAACMLLLKPNLPAPNGVPICGDNVCSVTEADGCPEDCTMEDCASEGATINLMPGGPQLGCCEGLQPVGCMIDAAVCERCGDGICRPDEECGCSEDCRTGDETTGLPDFCEDVVGGFKCNNNDTEVLKRPKAYCESLDGRWGPDCCFCPSHPARWNCDFPYLDAGEECVNSVQCEGRCLLDKDFAEERYGEISDQYNFDCEGCTGTCEKYPLFSWFYELNDGEVFYDLKIC